MAFQRTKIKLKRAKSTGALNFKCENHFCNVNIPFPTEEERKNSNMHQSEEPIFVLKYKLQKLYDIIQKQQHKLKIIQEDMKIFHSLNKATIELCNLSAKITKEIRLLCEFIRDLEPLKSYDPAKNLLDAIELRHAKHLDMKMKNVISNPAGLLKNEHFIDNIAANVAESIRRAFDECFLETSPNTYQMVTEQNNGNTYHVGKPPNKTYTEIDKIEENSTPLLKFSLESTQSLDFSCEKQKSHLKARDTVFFKTHSKSIPKLTDILIPPPQTELNNEKNCSTFVDVVNTPMSPPQPLDPDLSTIDHLMKSALIYKHIKEGHVNKSFEEALSSSHLSLVMAACRAADPVKVFNPCTLTQPVLLSLIQQLATDMVHETQLKCRYLEEALINLDVSEQGTRTYLPLVVGEVRKHLSSFIRSYPNHVASRRITLIVMAADNLLK